MQNESALNNNDKVHWYLEGVEVAGSPFTYTTSGTADLIIPASLAPGLHNYTSRIESAAGCLGDLSDPYEIFKLPAKTLALTVNNSTYCGANSGSTSGSVITATTTAAGVPAGIEYAYTWTVTQGGNPATPGSADNSNSATSLYTMNTTVAGTYIFNATVKYVLSSGNTGTLVAADTNGCEVNAAATQTVIVTPKPTKPTIVLAP
ncbi:hypothetical protein [Pedobacter ureilyticus]|uniref:SprB repeat-containing protein n=1 Tax=Pedobacter ureilyticus TaxID=1393051 RepID=A0ABW9J9N4_9SPHI|nr:hypothetical protein [Pedobacter helvus]